MGSFFAGHLCNDQQYVNYVHRKLAKYYVVISILTHTQPQIGLKSITLCSICCKSAIVDMSPWLELYSQADPISVNGVNVRTVSRPFHLVHSQRVAAFIPLFEGHT